MAGLSIPDDFLKDIPTNRLAVLAQKDDEFLTYFSQLDLDKIDKMREIQRKREIMNNKNREVSIENTELRPLFDEKKEKLTNSCLVAAELKETYERKYTQLKTMAGTTDRATLHRELQQAMKTAEKESEDLADNYLDGSTQMSSDEFINQFLSYRSSYWSRRVKSEKMEIIMKQPLPYPSPPSNQPIYATPTNIGGQPPYPPSHSIPPYPPSANNEAPPPTYNSLTGGNPTQSVSASYTTRPAPPIPTASMPVPPPASHHNWGGGGSVGGRNSYPSQGYPQASYRASPQNYSQPPPPQGSYRPPPQGGGTIPPAVGHSYPIYQSGPYYPNQYGGAGGGGGYPPRR